MRKATIITKATKERPDRFLLHAKARSDDCVVVAAPLGLCDCANVGACQTCKPVGLELHSRCAALLCLVTVVVGLGAEEQVLSAHTGHVVAPMKNAEAFRNRPECDCPSDAVRRRSISARVRSTHAAYSVPSSAANTATSTLPRPALSTLVHLAPEPRKELGIADGFCDDRFVHVGLLSTDVLGAEAATTASVLPSYTGRLTPASEGKEEKRG